MSFLRAALCLLAAIRCHLRPGPNPTPSPVAAPSSDEKPLTALPYTPSLDVPSMDKTVDPCVDFYQYSCGGWRKNNPIPGDQAAWSVYAKLHEDNQRFLWGVLQELSTQTSGRTPTEQKIGDYFGACMNEPAIEKLGAKPLQPALAEIAALKSKKDLATLAGHRAPARR